jgi:hypothetical protein
MTMRTSFEALGAGELSTATGGNDHDYSHHSWFDRAMNQVNMWTGGPDYLRMRDESRARTERYNREFNQSMERFRQRNGLPQDWAPAGGWAPGPRR